MQTKQKAEYVEASQVFDDDNNGYSYGINIIENDDIIDCLWFKTKKERENASKDFDCIK
jgi:hypothetical protein